MEQVKGTEKKYTTVFKAAKRLWYRYKIFVEKVTGNVVQEGEKAVGFWRTKLFTNFVTYLLPLCLIALIPGAYMALHDGYLSLAAFDVIAACLIAIITLNIRINLFYRKVFLISILYSLAAVLMVCFGLFGPGVIYLFALSIFMALIFPRRFSYWSGALNLLVCTCGALVIWTGLFDSPLIKQYSIGAWIAICSNLIFLSWVCVILINGTIHSLENTILKENHLRKELQKHSAERILSNRKLKESEGHYKSLFFLSPSPMWVLDQNTFQFLQVNEAAIQHYGYTEDEFLSMSIKDIKQEKDINSIDANLQKTISTGVPVTIYTEHFKKDNEQFHVEVIFASILYNGKEAALAVVRDITEQMNYTREIERKNTKLGEIAYIQSHHVRAPLANILGIVSLINENKNERIDAKILSCLNASARDLDQVIRTISKNTESV